MGKALLIIVAAAILGGTVTMYQSQNTERQTEQGLVEAEAVFLAREAARSGYEIGAGNVASGFAAQTDRMNVRTEGVSQGTYDLTVNATADGTLVVTSTGRAPHLLVEGGTRWVEHTMWGEFTRIVELPSAIVLDAELVAPSFTSTSFSISGNDMRPTSTASGSTPDAGRGDDSYAVMATQPGGASTVWGGLQSAQQASVSGLGEGGATGAVSQGTEYPALLESIYDEAMSRVVSGQSDVVTYTGDLTFAGAETFGSSALQPKIVYINGDVVMRGKVQGYGVLIVEGNLTIEALSSDPADNFAWEGLVYVRDEGVVSFSQTGATRIDGALVVQAPTSAGADTPIDFDIGTDGGVTVNEPFAARVKILGASMSYYGYDIPATLGFTVGGDSYAPWGSPTNATAGNINDGQNPRSFDVPNIYNANEKITLVGRSFIPPEYSGTGSWKQHFKVETGGTNTQLVKVLRNGDSVPQIPGFQDQTSIAEYVDEYVVDGRIQLADNQAIYLFELITNDLTSEVADFQDIVALVTLSTEAEVEVAAAAESAGLGDSASGATSMAEFTVGGEAKIQYSSEAVGRVATYLQTAQAAAKAKSVKQRSFDPQVTYEMMAAPAEGSGSLEEGSADMDPDELITVCYNGETLTVTVEAFGEVDGATLGPCVDSGSTFSVCHKGSTVSDLSESALPAHLMHGDTVGTCRSSGGDDDA